MMEEEQLCVSLGPEDTIVSCIKTEKEEEVFVKDKDTKFPLQISPDPGDTIVRIVKTEEEEEEFVRHKEEEILLQISPDLGDIIVRNVKTEEEEEEGFVKNKKETSLQIRPEEKLIEVVRNHPELYDTCHCNYSKAKLKQEIWITIANQLNLTNGEEAKNSWTKLRNNHRDALRRQRHKSGAAAQPSKPWKFQHQMKFLLPFMVNENGETNFTIDDEHSNPLSQDQNADSESQYLADPVHKEVETLTQPNTDNEEGNSLDSSAPPQKSLTPTSRPKKKAKRYDVDNLLLHHFEQREQMSKERSEERKKMEESLFPKDDLYFFFMSMYEQARKMPPASQHFVRRNVFLTVSQEEARLLNIAEPLAAPQYQQLYPVCNNDQHMNFPHQSQMNSPASSICTTSLPPSASSPGSMDSCQGNVQLSNLLQNINRFNE